MAEWFKRFPRAALNGMRGLSLEERGAYNLVLDLIYEEEGPVADRLCQLESGAPRAWARIRDSLVAKGKLVQLPDGRLTNHRAQVELINLQLSQAERAAAGRKGGKTRAAREAEARVKAAPDLFDQTPEKPLNSGLTGVEPELSGSSPRLNGQLDPEKPKEINGTPQAELKHLDPDPDPDSSPPAPPCPDDDDDEPRKKDRKARQLPATWQRPEPTPSIATLLSSWTPDEVDLEEAKFREQAKATGRTLKDWDAGWRTWLLNASQYRRKTHDRNSTGNWTAATRF